jgi:hypothetical protein
MYSTHAHRYTHLCMGESFPAKAGTASRHVQDLKLSYPKYTYMGRPTYVCATCSEHFTRKYSATRHNITIHGNRGEISLLDFLAGRSSGRYQASHRPWYRRIERRIHNFGHATTAVADSMGDTFRHRGLQGQYHDYPRHQQQAPSPLIPLPPPSVQDVLPYPPDQISKSQPMKTTNNKGTLSQETRLKIQELKRLLYRYPVFSNPDVVIKCVTHFSIINGDNTLLDEKLEQLRNIDAISK